MPLQDSANLEIDARVPRLRAGLIEQKVVVRQLGSEGVEGA